MSKNLYPLSKRPPQFRKILVILRSLDKGFYGILRFIQILIRLRLNKKNASK